MKYYSEVLKKVYDTEEELKNAESSAEKVECSKKELAKKVEQADKRIELAYDNYSEAKKKVNSIIDEANKKIKEVMEPARKEIKDAELAKTEAIKEFNSKYGVYITTYSGERALKEYEKFAKTFDSMLDKFFTTSWLW